MRVVTTLFCTKSSATVSDETNYDTAHALLTLEKIVEPFDDTLSLFSHVIYVSDGAAAHFKNRFQVHEMSQNSLLLGQLFSASGHGKSASDGIGGSLKHMASLHNMRCPLSAAIQTAADFVCVLTGKGNSTHLLRLLSSEVSVFQKKKKKNGSQCHRFLPSVPRTYGTRH